MQADPVANVPRLTEFMDEARVDAIVASAPHNVRYLTGYHNSLDVLMREWMSHPGASEHPIGAALAVFSPEQRSALVVGPGFASDGALADIADLHIVGALATDVRPPVAGLPPSLSRLGDARRYPAGHSMQAVAHILLDRGLDQGRIGIDTSYLSSGAREELALAVPRAHLLDCRNLLRLTRMVKTPIEIALLRRSAEINERSAVAAAATTTGGDSTGSLMRRFRASVADAGALVDHCTPTVAGTSFVGADGHVFSDEETFALDVGCSVEGYYADAQFTVSVTPASARAAAGRYDIVRRCVLDVGVAHARAGTRASAMHHAMASFLSQERVAAFPSGHGVGLEYRDYPIVVPDTGLRISDECVDRKADLPLEIGMVLNVEATAFLAGGSAVGCEVTCLVTSGDPLLLSPEDRSLRISKGLRS